MMMVVVILFPYSSTLIPRSASSSLTQRDFTNIRGYSSKRAFGQFSESMARHKKRQSAPPQRVCLCLERDHDLLR